jgi:hypothetical protein
MLVAIAILHNVLDTPNSLIEYGRRGTAAPTILKPELLQLVEASCG